MSIVRRLYRQGNSTVVSIPGWMLAQQGMERGDPVELRYLRDDAIAITRLPDDEQLQDAD